MSLRLQLCRHTLNGLLSMTCIIFALSSEHTYGDGHVFLAMWPYLPRLKQCLALSAMVNFQVSMSMYYLAHTLLDQSGLHFLCSLRAYP